jgi:hypothetical protein
MVAGACEQRLARVDPRRTGTVDRTVIRDGTLGRWQQRTPASRVGDGKILELFMRSVVEPGYDGTNMGDVATEFGISKSTIMAIMASTAGGLTERGDKVFVAMVDRAAHIVADLDTAARLSN